MEDRGHTDRVVTSHALYSGHAHCKSLRAI